MGYCPRCGSQIPENEVDCPCCGYQVISEENQWEFNAKEDDGAANLENKEEQQTNEEEGANTQENASAWQADIGQNAYSRNTEENQPLSLLLQIIIIVLVVMMPGIGSLIGVVAGVIFMGKAQAQHQKFGKIVLIISLATLAFYFLCCCLFIIAYVFFGVLTFGGYY